jgi:hypothetical protein
MVTRRIVGIAGLLLTSGMCAGCGSSGPTTIPIRGEVYFNGAPLKDVPQGLVHYIPKSTEGRQASGRLQPDGSFELTTFQKADGVMPGEYDIAVSAYSATAELSRAQVEAARGMVAKPGLMIPEKYTEPKTSGLSDTVDSNHTGFKRIELTE